MGRKLMVKESIFLSGSSVLDLWALLGASVLALFPLSLSIEVRS